uniref:Uncharacterized protein n=1 Tax=Chromera velia CCMP2878 TaxID=1169474 RepID=A0A0G4I9Q6_9ALVE|eukprot:Cvel_12337.t1-p1 / transcript=Cvel_12337.t1 / gene=Cvel_12337 / organism=Chromera_velia_CCMP2878 / gene_product=hypothetical protein / transcript_product=hypothetical protein / location=Cvel_scaffold803:13494-14983(-) / protein_length=291 / sequence_SO=supercontig / SO=protein_coding / is_pseudo=false
MDREKAGAGASFQSTWLRGDGSPGLHPIEYHQGPPYVGKGLQALVERCIHSNREGVALLMLDPNHRFPLAVIHLVAMGECWGYSCVFRRTVGGIPFTLTFRRAPPGWRVGVVVCMPSLGTELYRAEASIREAGVTGARPRSPSPAVFDRTSVDSGESPLPDFFAPFGFSIKGTILDHSSPGVLRMPNTVQKHTRTPSRGRRVKDPGPVFFDKKGKRLLRADGEPLGYNWKVKRPVFMTYRRGMYDAWTSAWTCWFALMLHPDLGEITQGEVFNTLKNYLAPRLTTGVRGDS